MKYRIIEETDSEGKSCFVPQYKLKYWPFYRAWGGSTIHGVFIRVEFTSPEEAESFIREEIRQRIPVKKRILEVNL